MTTTTTTTTGTTLAQLAEKAAATGTWWSEETLDKDSPLILPTRVLRILENAGISTVEQLKAAGPDKLRSLPKLGKLGFTQIVDLLRALDRTNGADT